MKKFKKTIITALILCLSVIAFSAVGFTAVAEEEFVTPVKEMYGMIDAQFTPYNGIAVSGDAASGKSITVAGGVDATCGFLSYTHGDSGSGYGNFEIKLSLVSPASTTRAVVHFQNRNLNFVINNTDSALKGLYVTNDYGDGETAKRSNIIPLPQDLTQDITFTMVQQSDYSYKLAVNGTQLTGTQELTAPLELAEGKGLLFFKLWTGSPAGGIKIKSIGGGVGYIKPTDPEADPVSCGSFDVKRMWNVHSGSTSIADYENKTVKIQGKNIAWENVTSSRIKYDLTDFTIKFKMLETMDSGNFFGVFVKGAFVQMYGGNSVVVNNSALVKLSADAQWGAAPLTKDTIKTVRFYTQGGNRKIAVDGLDITPLAADSYNTAFSDAEEQYIDLLCMSGANAKEGYEIISIGSTLVSTNPLGLWQEGDADNGASNFKAQKISGESSTLVAQNDTFGVAMNAKGAGWAQENAFIKNGQSAFNVKTAEVYFGAYTFDKTEIHDFEVVFRGIGGNALIVRTYHLGADKFSVEVYSNWTAADMLAKIDDVALTDLDPTLAASGKYKVNLNLNDQGKVIDVRVNNTVVPLITGKTYNNIVFDKCNASLYFQMPDKPTGVMYNDLNRVVVYKINNVDVKDFVPAPNVVLYDSWGVYDYSLNLADDFVNNIQCVKASGTELNKAVFGFKGKHRIRTNSNGFRLSFKLSSADFNKLNVSYIMRGGNTYYKLALTKGTTAGTFKASLFSSVGLVASLDNLAVPQDNIYSLQFRIDGGEYKNVFTINNSANKLATGVVSDNLFPFNNAYSQIEINSVGEGAVWITSIDGGLLNVFNPAPNAEKEEVVSEYEGDAFGDGNFTITDEEKGTGMKVSGDWQAVWKKGTVAPKNNVFSVFFKVDANNYTDKGVNVVFRNTTDDIVTYTDGYIIRITPSGNKSVVNVYSVAFVQMSSSPLLLDVDMSAGGEFLVEYDNNSKKIFVNKREVAGNYTFNLPAEHTQFGVVHSSKSATESKILIYQICGEKITAQSLDPEFEAVDPNEQRREYEVEIAIKDNDACKDYPAGEEKEVDEIELE